MRVKFRWIGAGRGRAVDEAVDEVVDEVVETVVDEAKATTKMTRTRTEDGCLHSVSVRAFWRRRWRPRPKRKQER